MSTHMTMNIAIKEEAYAFLKSLKRNDRSFSDVILSFKQKTVGKDIMRFYGILTSVDWDSRKTDMRELRREFEERL